MNSGLKIWISDHEVASSFSSLSNSLLLLLSSSSPSPFFLEFSTKLMIFLLRHKGNRSHPPFGRVAPPPHCVFKVQNDAVLRHRSCPAVNRPAPPRRMHSYDACLDTSHTHMVKYIRCLSCTPPPLSLLSHRLCLSRSLRPPLSIHSSA